MSTLRTTLAGHWTTFWFGPQPAYPLGLVRMAFGLLAVIWTLAALDDVRRVFGTGGPSARYVLRDYQWTVFRIWTSDTALLIGWGVLLLAAIALMVGWHARVAALLVFVLLYSFDRRGLYLYNAGDALIVIIALVLALSSCGAALSLDQRRRTGSFWSAQTVAPWSVRLLQVQLSLIYVFAAQAKLSDRTWVDGSAMFYAWHTDGKWAMLTAPDWVSSSAVLVNAISWGAVLIELAIAVLVWNRRCRPWVLAVGVVMHLLMMLTLNVGLFSLAMYVLYLAFVPWDVVRSLPERAADRWRTARRRGART
ncbi:hypothetical protein MMAD_44970 [Mycolicibacterium madagascariense]|uniref:HTTM-like domain-containing protein n=1 Tax=Mycolicibacterium madagascariense TaxID=212765 RepID=A0A7I7XMC8_9MYCO|nr:HTTM domain-containing protein [Mycolicibacterium madagascariense]MCV7012522.1 HTTM domain-containing protein [Mycolicibacterium madagascariense]BBZ30202.1 hypothetical protein MMAD_44970 [Mycolicibacterium madagascariense]